jgi:ATP/maltotriose-dependent transcriptional regulator MalT
MAARYLAESERIYRLLDNPAGLAFTLLLQGQIAAFQGDVARAQVLWDEGERLAAEVDDHNLKLRILLGQLSLAWLRGDDDFARRQYEQFFIAIREMNDTTRLSVSLVFMPAILHRQGLSVWAARVYGLADKLAQTSEPPKMSGELFDSLLKRATAARAEVRAQLGDEVFSKSLAEGQTMTVEDLLTIPHPSSNLTSRVQATPASVLYESLTARELEVLHLLAQDLSNPQIAQRLVVSRRTVDAHLRAIYEKLGVKSRDAALRVAIEHGLIEK